MAATCTCCASTVEWWVRLRSHPDQPICHDCLAGLNAQRDGQLQLMTGSWLVTGVDPIFRVADLAASLAWYERVGFEVSRHDETYAFAHWERDLSIHLAEAEGEQAPGNAAVYLHCQDADRVAAEWRARGVGVDGPRHEDHGRREGSIVDPDGNVLRFGSPSR